MMPRSWAWHGSCSGRQAMEPIDSQALENVRGGFGALLGALIQGAPGIINSISGLISASKGGGGGGQTAVAQAQSPASTAPMSTPPSMPEAPTQMASAPSGGSCACCCSGMLPTAPSVQNSVRIG